VKDAELHALRSARPAAGPHFHFGSRPTANEAVLEAAVLQAAGHNFRLDDPSFYEARGDRPALPKVLAGRVQRELKARYSDQVQQSAHTLFKGRIGLQELLVCGARTNGYTGPAALRDDGDIESVLRASNWARNTTIEAEGASNTSLANVLANVMNKFLLQGYLFVEQAWRQIAAVRPVKDFKPTKSVNLYGDFIYEKVGSSGELKNATLSDQAFANQADQYGRIITLDRKQIMNDDLGALTTVPTLLGRGAGLRLNQLFWSAFNTPSAADNGQAFWNAAAHAASNALPNLLTGAGSALSSASLQAAVTAFNKQTDPAGYPLGIEPEILLYPSELDVTARELMNSQFLVYGGASAAKQPNTNIWAGRFTPVMSRYLSNPSIPGFSATGWYLLGNPALAPVVEVAFVNGVDVPTVQTAGPDFQFDRLGISARGVFDCGVNNQNFRGGVKSAGA
jgi:hypothetical protein